VCPWSFNVQNLICVTIIAIVEFSFQSPAMFVFYSFSRKWSYLMLFILWRSVSIQNSMVPSWSVQVLHPRQYENPTIAIFKIPLKKIIIQIKLVGTSMIVHCTSLILSSAAVNDLSQQNKMLILNRPSCSDFFFSQKWFYSKFFIPWRYTRINSFMVLHWLVQVLHPPQKFELPPF
jgi:hypothetical protein